MHSQITWSVVKYVARFLRDSVTTSLAGVVGLSSRTHRTLLVSPVWTDQQIDINGPFELNWTDRFFCFFFLVVLSECLPEEVSKRNQPFLEHLFMALCNDSITCNIC